MLNCRRTSLSSYLLSYKVCDVLVILAFLVTLVIFVRENSERRKLMQLRCADGALDGQKDSNLELAREKVVLGAVLCRSNNETKEENRKGLKYRDATVVMLKTVLISARLYKIPTVELHLFFEHPLEDSAYVEGQLLDMGYPSKSVNLLLKVYSAVNAVPEQYREHMVYHPRYRCGYTRFFFPSMLPEVDAIVHLDSDMLITGDLWELWRPFSQFQGEQLIGVVASNEPHDTHYVHMSDRWFGDIPHPPPRGINAGLLIMNLTRMRDYGWEKKFLREYDDYSKIVSNLTGQRTVNILLGHDPGILKVVSCKLNFFHRHCDRGFTCEDAAADEGGIHLVHGNGFKMEQGGVFHALFQSYQKFNMSLIRESPAGEDEDDGDTRLVETVKSELMYPIRQAYRLGACSNMCCGTLDQVLFSNFFE